VNDLYKCLRGEPVESSDDLLEEASRHSVLPLVARRLKLRAPLEKTAMQNVLRHRDFAVVAKALRERGVEVLALKGIHLASVVYRDLAVRPMRDLDLLVRAEDLQRAGEALESIGYAPSRSYTTTGGATPYAVNHHLPQFTKSGATLVEIHWHIIPPSFDQRIDIREMWERSQTIRIAGEDVRVFAPEDLLLHLAVHATYSHACDLSAQAWCDIAETTRRHEISWPDVVERAIRWRCSRGTYLALRMSRDLLAAPIPDDVLAALMPSDFDPDLLRIAARSKPSSVTNVSLPPERLAAEKSFFGKVRTIVRRVFLPRDTIADLYAVPRSSPLVPLFYALRVRDALRNWRAAMRLRGNSELRQAALDTLAMETFLHKKEA